MIIHILLGETLNSLRNKMKKLSEGFTLVEILIVVVIIGILATIAIPTYLNYVQKGYASDAKVQLKNILESAEIFYQESGEWPADIESLEEDGYLGIKPSTKRKWQFDISESEISATSLADMKGGEGHVITLLNETGEFRGYGEKEK